MVAFVFIENERQKQSSQNRTYIKVITVGSKSAWGDQGGSVAGAEVPGWGGGAQVVATNAQVVLRRGTEAEQPPNRFRRAVYAPSVLATQSAVCPMPPVTHSKRTATMAPCERYSAPAQS